MQNRGIQTMVAATAARQKARELALEQSAHVSGRKDGMKEQVRAAVDQLQQYGQMLRAAGDADSQPAEEWLLDHLDFLALQGLVVERALSAKAPRIARVQGGQPRIYALCAAYLDCTDGAYDPATWVDFVQSFQEVSVLTQMELWLLPVYLRAALLIRLAAVMLRVRARREAGDQVRRWLAAVAPAGKEPCPGALRQALENAGEGLPMSGAILVQLVEQLREYTEDEEQLREWLSCRLESGIADLDRLVSYEHQLQAGQQVESGHLISGLRTQDKLDWREHFDALSCVDQALRREAAGTYARLDFTSRDRLRQQVATLSNRLRVPEQLIAEQAVELANRNWETVDPTADPPSRACYVPYYLLDPVGIKALVQGLRACTTLRKAASVGRMQQHAAAYYFATLTALFAAFMLIFVGWVYDDTPMTWRLPSWLAVIAAVFLPVSEWAVTIAHALIESKVATKPLLRFDYSQGVDPHAATLVVIPVIWSTQQEVHELVERLEMHYLANRDPQIHFALLGDFVDADSAVQASDQTVLSAARTAIEELAKRYEDTGSTFHLFHRRRVYNESQGVWMGWERKRGKLVELVELLQGSSTTSYEWLVGPRAVWSTIRYIITLDTDTQLPMGTAMRMIGTIDLPYNRPRLAADGSRVVEGYGVLQPRVGIKHEAVMRSRLAALWAGNPGIDPYAFAVSDPYQDAFGQGIFTGKGIFDVATFGRLLCERIPDNRVLSHDLLEGGFLRAGLLADIEVIDDHPGTYTAYQARLHRWVRGDWQLLDWLRKKTPDRRGRPVRTALGAITRWQMIDNLRRSLLPPALFIALLLGFTCLPGLPVHYALAVAFTLCLPALRQGVHVLRVMRRPRDILVAFAQALVSALLLPFAAALMLDATLRTLWRLYVSRRRLLEWVSSAQMDRLHMARRTRALLREPLGYLLIAIFAVSVAGGAASESARSAGLLLCVIWAFAPAYVRLLDQPVLRPRPKLGEEQQKQMTGLAQEIWRFFVDYATEQEHFLPPDNVQLEPDVGVAARTSPTNVALLLASTVAACDLGFIDRKSMCERLARTVETIEAMDKWHGHLYNWYDTRTLKPLPPLYVSTVDSGNLVAALIAVKAAVLESSDDLYALASRLEALITQTDFRPLYDHRAQLFTLGYHVEIGERETILYDLLASEARQASFVAIALGQVSVAHWFSLGRSLVKAGPYKALLAWSGTMFEYFMPPLFMKVYSQTLWTQTYRGALWRQQQYAKAHNVPWGISESGYYAFDYQMNYQYRAFGVPGLGFKRGLDQDLVIAPYATLLAFPFAPQEVLANLRWLDQWGARGPYGYYEAIDCTQARMPRGDKRKIIKSFMAHHQGMSLVAIVNGLQNDVMVRRFHSDTRIATAELLLQERAPIHPDALKQPAVLYARPPERPRERAQPVLREYTEIDLLASDVCVLSSGAMTTVLTQSGSGYVRAQGLSVTRYREDRAAADYGPVLYVRRVETDVVWSPTYAPCKTVSPRQRVQFGLDKATFMRVDDGIETLLEVCVAPEHSVDVRRLTLTNTLDTEQLLEVTSFVELALARQDADEAHPTFSKLFVETAYCAEEEALVAHRRPRTKEEAPVFAAHALQVAGTVALGALEYDSDRLCFIGRGHDLSNPQGLRSRLSERVGAVLDPAFVARRTLRLPAGASVQLFALLATGGTQDEALEGVRHYAQSSAVDRAFSLAWTRSRIELRHEHMADDEAALYQRLAGLVTSSGLLPEARADAIVRNSRGQSSLWAHGISGDVPLCLISIADEADLPFVRKLARGHRYLRRLGIVFDLVVLCEVAGGYRQDLREAVSRAVDASLSKGPGGLFVLGADQMESQDVDLVRALARVTLAADGPSLAAQLRRSQVRKGSASVFALPVQNEGRSGADAEVQGDTECPVNEAAAATQAQAPGPDPEQGLLYNGWGAFVSEGKEYLIALRGNCNLKAPWTNVMANPHFGCLVTELGSGYTWWKNSRECKLTPWRNDPVVDRPGEVLYITDEQTGETFGPMAAPIREQEPYTVAHGFGYSRFTHHSHGIWQEATVFVPIDAPVKVVRVCLRNDSQAVRLLSVTYYAEWVLGVKRDAAATCQVFQWDESRQALITRNAYQEVFRNAHAFLRVQGVDVRDSMHLSDREAFLGPHYDLAQPAALGQTAWPSAAPVASDPCAAVRRPLTLQPGQTTTLYVLLGCESSPEAVQALLDRYVDGAQLEAAFAQMQAFWQETTEQVQVVTPSRELNLLVNGWLLYQTLSCRMWARTAFYQAGGAYGFRDQLQDALALLHTRPDLTRAQILLHAAHQFVEGDVQHWWHEETRRGIRTRFSDDLLWLPYAVARYVAHTGDQAIWDEEVAFLTAAPLAPEEDERNDETVVATATGTVYEHCKRALLRSQQVGEHGLPLMGSGDWNDGLSAVGPKGRGESVWLGWFLCDILARFEGIAQRRADAAFAQSCRETRERLQGALDDQAWDGQWYRRAFTDAGQWLGSVHDAECRIDAIAQSWSVISDAAAKDKRQSAMRSFDRELVDRELAIAKLLTPPFSLTDPSPGYIAGYPPGVRENGGQYTHGVIWAIIAWCLLGDGERAFELFHLLSPQTHTATPGEVAKYAGEPYVMAADVYAQGPYQGRAGWTWYTGAAGWMYQAALEWILGVRRTGDELLLEPCLPGDWKQVAISYRYGATRYEITIHSAAGRSTPGEESVLTVDGSTVCQGDKPRVSLQDDGAVHEVSLML